MNRDTVIWSMRHAQAGKHPLHDMYRPLSDEGVREATWMHENVIKPSLGTGMSFVEYYSSPAARTLQMLQISTGFTSPQLREKLYPVGIKQFDVMYEELGYQPLGDYLDHRHGEFMMNHGEYVAREMKPLIRNKPMNIFVSGHGGFVPLIVLALIRVHALKFDTEKLLRVSTEATGCLIKANLTTGEFEFFEPFKGKVI